MEMLCGVWNMNLETDLTLEATELLQKTQGDPGRLPGVATREYQIRGFHVAEVRILNEKGAEKVGKPVGTYLTLTMEQSGDLERTRFCQAAEAVAESLQRLLELKLSKGVLVVGLGNRAITADALGPLTVDNTVVTRHLVTHLPETFGEFRPVAAVSTGVLGTTGLESGELVGALCRQMHPAAVIAVDALAARSASRLGCTIQLSDSGIVPGSGVGNARQALNREHLGIPVIAVGVPTVIRASALCADLGGEEEEQQRLRELVVTPKEVDRMVASLSRTVGIGISLALQEGLSVEDVEMLLA